MYTEIWIETSSDNKLVGVYVFWKHFLLNFISSSFGGGLPLDKTPMHVAVDDDIYFMYVHLQRKDVASTEASTTFQHSSN